MAKIDLGRITPTYRGDYDSTVSYNELDIVYDDTIGKSFIAKQASKGKDLPVDKENEYWGIIAKQGPKGTAGEVGPKGDKGAAGDQGIQGERGPKGDQGDQGPRGPQGIQGDQGVAGPKGDKGDTGKVDLGNTNISDEYHDLSPYLGEKFIQKSVYLQYKVSGGNITLIGNVTPKEDIPSIGVYTIFKNLPVLLKKSQNFIGSASGYNVFTMNSELETGIQMVKYADVSNTTSTTITAGTLLSISSTWAIDVEYIETIGRTDNGSKYWMAELPNAAIELAWAGNSESTLPRVNMESADRYSKRTGIGFAINAGRFLPDDDDPTNKAKGRPQGATYYNGVEYRLWNDEYSQALVIDNKGYLSYAKHGEKLADIDNIVSAVTGFYAFYDEGKSLPKPVVDDKHLEQFDAQPRSFVYQKYDGSYGAVVVAGRGVESSPGLTYEEMVEFVDNIGDVRFAFNLDGGGSAEFSKHGAVLNPSFDMNPTITEPRLVTNFLVFKFRKFMYI